MRWPIACGRALEEIRQLLQRLARINASGWIVRRIDDDEPGSRADGRVDRREIQVERGRLERHLARHGGRGKQQRLVAEPCRLGKDRFVSDIQNVVEGHHDGGERTGRQRDVRGRERQAQLAADVLGQERLRLRLRSSCRRTSSCRAAGRARESRQQARAAAARADSRT